ncbi:MAG TPA: MBL fold metallo-hydrolase [Planctomycetaceae bacterium]|nr:MBL fold metallo-hydrolase [Planctomycetaceae bacterium]
MLSFSLQSGSNGNAIYVEAAGVSLLFDAGISGRQAELRLRRRGRDIRQVSALLISHEHDDHIRCAGIYQRKFGIPVYATRRTLAETRCPLGSLTDVTHFRPGDCLDFGPLQVITVPTPHDAAEGVAFVIREGRRRLGVFTDLGHPFPALLEWLRKVDAAYLESNYDPHLLRQGPYPEWLKQRIQGPRGHLSNGEAAALVARIASKRLRWVVLAHLSEENNSPDLALSTHRAAYGAAVPLYVASRYEPLEPLEL